MDLASKDRANKDRVREGHAGEEQISENRPTKLWNAQFIKLFVIEFTLQLGLYILNPNLANYLITLGASITAAGFITSLNYGTALILRSVCGFICDLLNKKTLLLVACSGFVIASFGITIASSPEVVGFFRVVQGFAYVFKSSVVVSMASFVVPKESVGNGVGTMGLGFTVACSLGPAIGNWVGVTYGYRACCAMAIITFAIALVLSATVAAPKTSYGRLSKLEGKKSAIIKNELLHIRLTELFYLPALPLTLTVFLTFMAQSLMLMLLLTIANHEGIQNASFYYVAYAAVAIFSKPIAGKMLDKYGLLAVLAPMSFVSFAAMLLLALCFSTLSIVFAGILMAIGQGSVFSCLQASAVRNAPADKVGCSANMFYIGSDTTQFFTPTIFAIIFENFGTAACFLTAASTSLLGLLVYVILSRAVKKQT